MIQTVKLVKLRIMIKTNWNSEKITPETFLEKVEKTSDKPTGGETYLGITEDGRTCIIAISGTIGGDVLRAVILTVSEDFQKCKCDAADMSYGEFLEYKPRHIEMEEGDCDQLAPILLKVAFAGGWVSLNVRDQEFIKKLKSSLD